MTPELAGALGGEVTSIAFLWKMTRGDGIVLGFTSHDRDLSLDGVEYRARPGMTPSAISVTDGFTADSMEVRGALNATAIRTDDLDVGRWDGARVELFACDWSNMGGRTLRLMSGRIGDVARRAFGADASFVIELISDLAVLEQTGAPSCSPLCRAELGDSRCRVDMAGRSVELVALDGSGDRITLDGELEEAELYTDGRLRILTGPLAGLDRRVGMVSATEVHLEEPIWIAGLAGARLRLWEGCDKRFVTCSIRFGNFLSFDGEPHVPGNDALVRYGDI